MNRAKAIQVLSDLFHTSHHAVYLDQDERQAVAFALGYLVNRPHKDLVPVVPAGTVVVDTRDGREPRHTSPRHTVNHPEDAWATPRQVLHDSENGIADTQGRL